MFREYLSRHQYFQSMFTHAANVCAEYQLQNMTLTTGLRQEEAKNVNLTSENAIVKAENARLKAQLAALEADNARIQKENDDLKGENKNVMDENRRVWLLLGEVAENAGVPPLIAVEWEDMDSE
jgi:hypothetical protein